MLSETELREESDGSQRDVAAACSKVEYKIHHQRESWMGEKTIQLTFEIHVRTNDNDNENSSSQIFYCGLELPHGWIQLTRDNNSSYQILSTSVNETNHSSTLNGLMMKISPQYKENKENELFQRLQSLASNNNNDSDGDDDN